MNLTKSKLMCFTNKRLRQIPSIKIDNEEIKFTNKHDILGLRFDWPKLNWKDHIENVKKKDIGKNRYYEKIILTHLGYKQRNPLKVL